MARKTKLNPETQNKIIQGIRVGATHEHAAAYAGIDGSTFYNWMKRGEKEKKGIYFEFFEAVKKAQGESVVGLLAKINQSDTWQSKAWILERRFPDDYGRQKIDITSDNTTKIIIERGE